MTLTVPVLFLLIAVVVFGVDAVIHRSLVSVGLCLFAASFLVLRLT